MYELCQEYKQSNSFGFQAGQIEMGYIRTGECQLLEIVNGLYYQCSKKNAKGNCVVRILPFQFLARFSTSLTDHRDGLRHVTLFYLRVM